MKIHMLSMKIHADLGSMDGLEKDAKNHTYLERIKECNLHLSTEMKKLQSFIQHKPELEAAHSLSIIRHDLVNPVSGMKGYAEIILERTTDSVLTHRVIKLVDVIDAILMLIGRIIS